MPGIAKEVDLTLDDREVQRMIGDIYRRGEDLRPALNRVGAHMHHSVAETFRQQGRPTRWKPLSPGTIARRRKGRKGMGAPGGSVKILQDTGRLMASVTSRTAGSVFEVRPHMLRIGTRVEYASTHQFGREAIPNVRETVRAHVRKQHRRVAIARGGPGFARLVTVPRHSVRGHVRTVTLKPVPARVFLAWLDGDVRETKGIVADYWVEGRN